MNKEKADWILWAVDSIKEGKAKKLEQDNVIIYRCGTIIRVDIKGVFKEYD